MRWDYPDSAGMPVASYNIQYRAFATETWINAGTSTDNTYTSNTISVTWQYVEFRVQVRYSNGQLSDWSYQGLGNAIGASNQNPVMDSIQAVKPTININEFTIITANATDPDRDPLYYDFSIVGTSSPDTDVSRGYLLHLQYSTIRSNQRIYVAPDTEGEYTIRVTVSDRGGTDSTEDIIITVSEDAVDVIAPDRPNRPIVNIPEHDDATRMNVSWVAPNDNGTNITDYDLRYKRVDVEVWEVWAFSGADSTETIIGDANTPLDPGMEYEVQVRASNGVESEWSESGNGYTKEGATVTTPGQMDAPILSRHSDSRRMNVEFMAPSDTGGDPILNYQIRYRNDTLNEGSYTTLNTSIPFNPQPYILTGLLANNIYSVSMRARNTNGYAVRWSEDSTLDTGGIIDTPPRITSFTATDTTIDSDETTILTVVAEDDESDTITFSYDVVSSPSTATGSFVIHRTQFVEGATAGSATWTPPSTTGSYTIEVTATARGMTATRTIRITVSDPPVDPPSRPDTPILGFPTSTSLRIDWQEPDDDGGADIDEYEIGYRVQNVGSYTVVTENGNALDTTITSGISNTNRYQGRVRAMNDGNATWSAWSLPGVSPLATRPPRPSAPTVTEDSNDNRALNVSWTRPTDPNYDENLYPIVDYNVQYRISASSSPYRNYSFNGTGTNTQITGLTPNVTYAVQVQAVNSDISGAWSPDGTGTTGHSVPGAPTNLRPIRIRRNDIQLAWNPPSNNGGATITQYQIQYRLDGSSSWLNGGTTTSSPGTVDGLTTVEIYNFRVAARNSQGLGNYSVEINVETGVNHTPDLIIDVPSSVVSGGIEEVVATVSDIDGDTVTVMWGALDGNFEDNTALITDYNAPSVSSNITDTITCFADDGQGGTITKTASISIIAVTIPDRVERPDVDRVSGESTSLFVDWIAPYDGGSDITRYDIRYRERGTLGYTTFRVADAGVTYTSPVLRSQYDFIGSFDEDPSSGSTNDVYYNTEFSAFYRYTGSSWAGTLFSIVFPSGVTGIGIEPSLTGPSIRSEEGVISWLFDNYNSSTTYIYYDGNNLRQLDTYTDATSTTSTSVTINGFEEGTTYQFQVRAVNDVNDNPNNWSLTGEQTTDITIVQGNAPTVTLEVSNDEGPITVAQLATVTITADIVSTASGGITRYDWRLNQDGGTFTTTGNTSRGWRAPGNSGTYTVTLTVTDANGSASDTITLNVPDTALPTVQLTVEGDTGLGL